MLEQGWTTIRQLPTNSLFKRKENSGKVYRKDHYYRACKRWGCGDWDDISREILLSPATKVFVGFTF